MNDRGWKEVRELFLRVLEVDTAGRAEFLHAEAPNLQVEQAVLSLLTHHEAADSFLDEPAAVSWVGAERLAHLTDREGDRIGAYRLVQQVGRGGMGIVYRAVRDDGELRMEVAVKLMALDPEHTSALSHFRTERQLLAETVHPNIARFLDAGTTSQGHPYLIMEFVEGTSINRYCDEHRLSVDERLSLFVEVCRAIEFSHQHDVVHLDIKPSNILVTAEGVPKLLDFGIARLMGRSRGRSKRHAAVAPGSDSTTWSGGFTPLYASPEQLRGGQVDDRSDVFSLGVLLYILLTGRHPHSTALAAPETMAAKLLSWRPLRPSVAVGTTPQSPTGGKSSSLRSIEELSRDRCSQPQQLRRRLMGPLDRLTMKALAARPARRFQSVAEFREAIDTHIRAEASRVPALGYLSPAWRRARFLLFGMLSALILLALIPVVTTFLRDQADHVLIRGARITRQTHAPGVEFAPALGPGSERFAFAGGVCGSTHIHVQRRNATQAVDLTGALGGRHTNPAWSPAGTALAFERWQGRDSTLLAVDAQDGSIRPIGSENATRGATHPAWAPDGKTLAYARSDGVYAMDLEQGSETRLTALAAAADLSWSAQGDQLAFTVANSVVPVRGVLGELAPRSVWALDMSGAPARPITADGAVNRSPRWHRNGKSLFYVSDRDGVSDLYRADLSQITLGSRPLRLSVGLQLGSADIRRDFVEILYTRATTSASIHRIRLPEQGTVGIESALRVADTASDGVGLDISPDGFWLVFDDIGPGGARLMLQSVNGEVSKDLFDAAGDGFLPRWSPDGQQVFFYSNRAGVLAPYITDRQGHSLQRVAAPLPCSVPAGTDCAEAAAMSWPDRIGAAAWATRPNVFPLTVRYAPRAEKVAWVEGTSIAIGARLENPEVVVDLAPAYPVALAWRSSGTSLLAAVANRHGLLEIWSVDTNGAARRIVDPDPSVHAHESAIATHGDWLYFRRHNCESDLWRISLDD